MAIVDVQQCDRTFFNEPEAIAIQKLNAQKQRLMNHFKERHEIIEAMFLAHLSKNHVVMIGPPGTAKSNLIESFIQGIDGVQLFSWQVTKFTTPEEIFGPYSLAGLKAGKYERITANKLSESNIAYLDEIFNGNSSILNALNSSMNERIFEGKHIDLDCVYSGTNFIPEDPVLVAFYDRFLFRFIVEEIHEAGNFEAMLQLPEYELDPDQIIKKAEMALLQARIHAINVTGIIAQMVKIRELLKEESIFPSSRRFRWALKALQACALMNGRKEVIEEDLFILKGILWSEKKDIPVVEQVIAKAINPAIAEIKEHLNMAREIEKNIRDADPKDPKQLPQILEALDKLDGIVTEIEQILKKNTLAPKVMEIAKEICEQVMETGRKIKKEKLKINARF